MIEGCKMVKDGGRRGVEGGGVVGGDAFLFT